jgi:acylphosphatase
VKRARAVVSGHVQGVFYRVECATRARDAGLTGFVRNLPDGRVEAVFEGPDQEVDRLVAWCREGPSWARVDHVEITEEQPSGERDFRIA